MKTNTQRGFTLIELLVVVAIIGLMTSLVAVGYGNVRLKSRDSKRLSDMQQIKSGVDLYFTTAGGYPDSTVWNSGALICGNQSFMTVPRDPALNTYYEYYTENSTTGCGTTVWKNYYVQFTTEGPTDLGPPGVYYIGTRGFTVDPPF